jgi:uncharacterized protein (DUF697 family)
MLSRVSIGVGPVIALALLGLIEIVRLVRRRREAPAAEATSGVAARVERAGVRDGTGRGWLVALVVAAAIPVLAYAWMNVSRFGTPFGIPWGKQVIAGLSPAHRAMLDANGGSLFGVKLVPTTLVQAVRPDALGFSSVFPWVTFQRFVTPVFGGAVFNEIDFTSSVSASMPALVVLGLLGIVAVVWTRVAACRDVALLRAPLIGAAIGAAVSLAFTFIAARYLGDWIPLLTIAGLAGLQVLLARRRRSTRRWGWNVALVSVAVLAVFGVWVNFALGLDYQRLYSHPPSALTAKMLSLQYGVSDVLGAGTPDLVHSARLPGRPAAAGTTWITGPCTALYWSDGRTWVPVEGRPVGGWAPVRADFGRVGRSWTAVAAFGPAGRQDVVGVRRESSGLRFGLGRPDAKGVVVWIPSFSTVRLGAGPTELDILADRVNRSLFATVGDLYVLAFSPEPATEGPVAVGRGPVAIGRSTDAGVAPFPGAIRARPPQVATCDRLLDWSR